MSIGMELFMMAFALMNEAKNGNSEMIENIIGNIVRNGYGADGIGELRTGAASIVESQPTLSETEVLEAVFAMMANRQ